jgi:predicted transcriptional regulator of viral defense system
MPSFTGKDAKEHGVDPHLLPYYVKIGILEKVARGIYKNPLFENKAPFQWQDLFDTAQSIAEGTICLTSALDYYGLTLEIPRQFWIAVSHETKAPKRFGAKIVRMRNFTLGRIPLHIGDYHTFIFDRERCVVDAFRFLSRETAVYSLREYVKRTKDHRPDLSKLARYAESLRVDIIPYIEALV